MLYGHSRSSRVPWTKARTPHVRQLRCFEPHYLGFDAGDHFNGGAGVVLSNPCKDAVQFVPRRGLERDLHLSGSRYRLKTSSAGIVFLLGLASRRRTSATCSSERRRPLLCCSSMSSTTCATSACRSGGQVRTRSRIAIT